MQTVHRKFWPLVVLTLVLVFSVAIRINSPEADPPSHITFSGGVFTDEGNQCHNSRSKALFDNWFPDDWKITNYNPVLPYIKLAVFKLFGVGMWQLRLVNQLFAFLTLLVFYFLLRSLFSGHQGLALIGLLLLGSNFLYVMYNRIGTFETSLIFWVILCLFFLEKFRSNPRLIFLLAAGTAAFMGFVFKSLMLYLVPVPLVAYLLSLFFGQQEGSAGFSKGFKALSVIALGIVIVALPWYLFHYLPNKEWINGSPGQSLSRLLFPKNMDEALKNFVNFNWKDQFYKFPLIWLGSILYIPVFFRRLLSKRASLTEIATLSFFFAHTFAFLFLSYRPTRYLLPVVPVMLVMTLMLFRHFLMPKETVRPGITLYLLDTFWLTLALSFCFLPLISIYIGGLKRYALSLTMLAISALLVLLTHGFWKLYRKREGGKDLLQAFSWPLILLFAMVSLTFDLYYYLDWNRNKTHTVRDMSVEIGEKLDEAYIAGMTSSVAVLENRHKTLWLYPGFINWSADLFAKYPLTHILAGNDHSREVFLYFEQWPQRMEQAALLKPYHIKNYFLHLYSVISPYIGEGNREGAGSVRLRVYNPSREIVRTKVDQVGLGKLDSGANPEYELVRGQEEYILNPGENTVNLHLAPSLQNQGSVLLSLECNRRYSDHRPLRYEGEIFPSRIGENVARKSASNGYVRRSYSHGGQDGLLAYNAPFPYAPGVFLVDFHLEFGKIKSKVHPLCRLSIFSRTENQVLAERSLRPLDTQGNMENVYRLNAATRNTQILELRVVSGGNSEIVFDFADMTYLPGIILDDA